MFVKFVNELYKVNLRVIGFQIGFQVCYRDGLLMIIRNYERLKRYKIYFYLNFVS